MSVHLRKACGENLETLMRLKIAEDQAHLIAPNTVWLAQAAHVNEAETFGIFSGYNAIGLVSWIDPRLDDDDDFPAEHLYIWRFMIDHRFQGKGYARQSIDLLKQAAKIRGLKGVALTTMDKEKGNAKALYLKVGFVPTGRRVHDEIELALSLK